MSVKLKSTEFLINCYGVFDRAAAVFEASVLKNIDLNTDSASTIDKKSGQNVDV